MDRTHYDPLYYREVARDFLAHPYLRDIVPEMPEIQEECLLDIWVEHMDHPICLQMDLTDCQAEVEVVETLLVEEEEEAEEVMDLQTRMAIIKLQMIRWSITYYKK